MTFAVIKTGGKQYKVSEGQVLDVERLAHEGKAITFTDVLLIDRDGKAEVGRPFVTGAQVQAEVLSDGLADKKMVFRYKNKTRYKKKKGHRQPFTKVRITAISS
ncbi:MAG TPA: 50S ribosomal protein L21 [Candidatus Paceibacterota bacterium]|nr:50S ribosomal protein L21 [Candidatus Paceibacterota bacterium]